MGPCVRRDDTEIVVSPRQFRGRRVSFAGQTVETVRRKLTVGFKSSAIESAELDARILAGAARGLSPTRGIAGASRLVTSDESILLEDFARRRIEGEPVARILGAKEFWGLTLQLSTKTLVTGRAT